MKTILLSLFFTITFLQINYAQYTPFPEENARWSMVKTFAFNESNPGLTKTEGYVHEILNDTIINGLTYHNLYQRRTWWKEDFFFEGSDGTIIDWTASDTINETPKLIGALRQDTSIRKVYFIRFTTFADEIFDLSISSSANEHLPLNEEVLLYDFAVEIGDTISLGGMPTQRIISNINSIELNDGQSYRLYEHETIYGVNQRSFIEGLGGTEGLFDTFKDFLLGPHDNYFLNCFYRNDQYLIGEGLFGCDSIETLVPVIEVDQNTRVNISPNPFNNNLRIDFQAPNYSRLEIQLYNTLGQAVLHQFIDATNQYNLNTSSLAPGIYWLSVYDQNKLIGTKRVVKN